MNFEHILNKFGISFDDFDALDSKIKEYHNCINRRNTLCHEVELLSKKNVFELKKIDNLLNELHDRLIINNATNNKIEKLINEKTSLINSYIDKKSNLNNKVKSLDLLIAELSDVNEQYNELCYKLIQFYLNELLKNRYIVSVESIVKNLDISISYFNLNISKHLDRIHLPPSKYKVRTLLKEYIHDLNKCNKIKNIIGSNEDIKLDPQLIASLLKKKVLYSIDSYADYLEQNMILIARNINLKIPLSETETIKILEYFKCTETELNSCYKNIKKTFLKANTDKIKNAKPIESFNFIKYAYKTFDIFSSECLHNSKNFRSRNYFKTIYNVIYETEVDRLIESSPVSVRVFELKTLDNKNLKTRKRFMISPTFIKTKFEEILENPIFTDNIESTHNIVENRFFYIKLPVDFFKEQYSCSISELKKDLLML